MHLHINCQIKLEIFWRSSMPDSHLCKQNFVIVNMFLLKIVVEVGVVVEVVSCSLYIKYCYCRMPSTTAFMIINKMIHLHFKYVRCWQLPILSFLLMHLIFPAFTRSSFAIIATQLYTPPISRRFIILINTSNFKYVLKFTTTETRMLE